MIVAIFFLFVLIVVPVIIFLRYHYFDTCATCCARLPCCKAPDVEAFVMTDRRSPIYRPSAGAGPSGEEGRPRVNPENINDTTPNLKGPTHVHGKDCKKHIIDVPPGGAANLDDTPTGVVKGVCKGKCRGKDKETCKGGCKGKGNIFKRLQTTYSQMTETDTDTDSGHKRYRERRRKPRTKKVEKKETVKGSPPLKNGAHSASMGPSTSGGELSPDTGRSASVSDNMVKDTPAGHQPSPASCAASQKPAT